MIRFLGVRLLPSLHGSLSCNFPPVIYDCGGKATFEIHERYTGEGRLKYKVTTNE